MMDGVCSIAKIISKKHVIIIDWLKYCVRQSNVDNMRVPFQITKWIFTACVYRHFCDALHNFAFNGERKKRTPTPFQYMFYFNKFNTNISIFFDSFTCVQLIHVICMDWLVYCKHFQWIRIILELVLNMF